MPLKKLISKMCKIKSYNIILLTAAMTAELKAEVTAELKAEVTSEVTAATTAVMTVGVTEITVPDEGMTPETTERMTLGAGTLDMSQTGQNLNLKTSLLRSGLQGFFHS